MFINYIFDQEYFLLGIGYFQVLAKKPWKLRHQKISIVEICTADLPVWLVPLVYR